MNYLIDDPYFKVVLLQHTPYLNQLMWQAMHQDYSSEPTYLAKVPNESTCGKTLVKRLLEGHKGHYGVLEHPQLSFNVCYYPHTVMQQLRTHRVGITFDVQSTRYTGEQLLNDAIPVEQLFYTKPPGKYGSRNGEHFTVTNDDVERDMFDCIKLRAVYADKVTRRGWSYEAARYQLPYSLRQHFAVSCNLRTLLHLCALRIKADVEPETRDCVYRMWSVAKPLFPEIAEWYERYELGKARLAP